MTEEQIEILEAIREIEEERKKGKWWQNEN